MKNSYLKYSKFFALALALPFMYGCGAGAGTGALVGFLFGGGGSSVGELALLGSGSSAAAGSALQAGSAGVASLTNPEPASMFLLGGGLSAMAYFKSKTNRRK